MLQEAQYNSEESFKKVWMVFSMITYHRESTDSGIRPVLIWLHNWPVLKEAILVYILYLHKKTRFLKSHYTGFEYFKGSSIVYTDISCFDLTVASSNKNNNYNNK